MTVPLEGERIAVAQPVRVVARRPRLFATRTEEPRSRRATDVIMLVGATAGLALLSAIAAPPPGVERSFAAFVAAVPNSLNGLWRLLIGLQAVLALTLLAATVARRRWAVLRDLALAVVVALGASLVVGRIVTGSWPAVWDSLGAIGSSPYFPPIALAVPGAIVITASPHVTKPARRLGRWSVFLGLVGTVLLGTGTPTGAIAGVLVAAASAAATHLVFGSCMGRPSLDDVAIALVRLGVDAHSLGAAERQAAGLFVVDALHESGDPLVVKVYGRDAHDTQLVITVWRTIWYREAGAPTSFGRLQQAEHEAFLTLLAAQAGVFTQQVVTASTTPENDVVLVLRRAGQQLAEVPEIWSDAVVTRAWRTLVHLHDTGIAHGQLDDHHLIVSGGTVGLIDFRGARVAPRPEQLQTDHAQLLVAVALAMGMETALTTAMDALGADGLAATLPFVQLTALTTRQARSVRQSGLDLDELRSQAAERTGITAPDLVRMRRVTVRSVLQTGLLAVAFLALASGVGGLDFQLLAEQLRDATWWLVILGAVLAQTPRLASAVSTLGASPIPLPLAPVYALQLATSYISLAVPTNAARIAVNIRFFQRHGLRPGAALAIGALDGVAQFVVQLLLLLGILVLTPASLELSLDGSVPSGIVTLLVIVLVVAALAALMLVLVPRWRRTIFGWVGQLLHEAVTAARGLQSPRRLAMLIGGNLATELLFALALQTFARALGYQVGLAEVVLINVSVSLLSGLIPIPGGIGVVEGGLTYGLVLAGLPDETAFAAVLMYRLATFYLPPIWGFFALRWLERNKHL